MPSVLAHTKIEPGGSSGGTSAAIDTTGATLIFFPAIQSFLGGTIAISDSEGNAWVRTGGRASAGNFFKTDSYYCINPVTSATHTFTVGGGSLNQAADIIAVNGITNFDFIISGDGGSNISSIQPGPIAANGSPCVIFTFTGIRGDSVIVDSIDSGFTLSDQVAYVSGGPYGLALHYLVQASASSVNPTVSFTGTALQANAVSIAFFGPAAATFSIAGTESADSLSATLSGGAHLTAALTESADVMVCTMGRNEAITIALQESPDTIIAEFGFNIVINIVGQDGDSMAMVLENDGSWANCADQDTTWTECSDNTPAWNNCTPTSTTWTEN